MTTTRRFALLIALAAVTLTAACVPSRQPMTNVTQPSVEERKREVANLRDRGAISYEDAARQQFAIQRNAYALTEGEMSFWRASVEYAMMVDRRQITPEQYRLRVQEAYQRYVVATGEAEGRPPEARF